LEVLPFSAVFEISIQHFELYLLIYICPLWSIKPIFSSFYIKFYSSKII
jgi:hypothetical protein